MHCNNLVIGTFNIVLDAYDSKTEYIFIAFLDIGIESRFKIQTLIEFYRKVLLYNM